MVARFSTSVAHDKRSGMNLSISIEAKYQLASLKADFSFRSCSFLFCIRVHRFVKEYRNILIRKIVPSNWMSLAILHIPLNLSSPLADLKVFPFGGRIPFWILWKRCWLRRKRGCAQRGLRDSKSKFEFPEKDTGRRKVCRVKGKRRPVLRTKFKVTKFFYFAKSFDKFKSTLIHEPFPLPPRIPL